MFVIKKGRRNWLVSIPPVYVKRRVKYNFLVSSLPTFPFTTELVWPAISIKVGDYLILHPTSQNSRGKAEKQKTWQHLHMKYPNKKLLSAREEQNLLEILDLELFKVKNLDLDLDWTILALQILLASWLTIIIFWNLAWILLVSCLPTNGICLDD